MKTFGIKNVLKRKVLGVLVGATVGFMLAGRVSAEGGGPQPPQPPVDYGQCAQSVSDYVNANFFSRAIEGHPERHPPENFKSRGFQILGEVTTDPAAYYEKDGLSNLAYSVAFKIIDSDGGEYRASSLICATAKPTVSGQCAVPDQKIHVCYGYGASSCGTDIPCN